MVKVYSDIFIANSAMKDINLGTLCIRLYLIALPFLAGTGSTGETGSTGSTGGNLELDNQTH